MPPEPASPVITVAAASVDDPELVNLITALDAELNPLYPEESRHGYDLTKLQTRPVTLFIARLDGLARACGGVEINGSDAEIKRMYVHPAARGIGLGQQILAAIEQHAAQAKCTVIRLETGIHQHAAIKLYSQAGYREIPAFSPYKPDPVSVFMAKALG